MFGKFPREMKTDPTRGAGNQCSPIFHTEKTRAERGLVGQKEFRISVFTDDSLTAHSIERKTIKRRKSYEEF